LQVLQCFINACTKFLQLLLLSTAALGRVESTL